MRGKTLRSQLFLSVGVILCIVALLSYLLPEIFIRRDLRLAAVHINQFFAGQSPENQEKLRLFFGQLRAALVTKISTALLATILLSLGVALLLLNRISKKITQPIAKLAKASREIGKGIYERLDLPEVGNRDDEVAMLAHSFEKMAEGLAEKEKIRGVLNKVVSKQVAEELLGKRVELGGEERVVTMLFCDIRGFTHLFEGMEPKELIALLNDYMTTLCQAIDAKGGIVDKFVGDEIMALFGAPLPQTHDAIHAVEAALQMVSDLRIWNRSKKIPFECGFGIHRGVVCAGNMGANDRLNYTVIGANVNLAARLCSAAQPMQVIVSKEVMKEAPLFSYSALAPLHLKGVEHPVEAFTVQKL